MRLEHITRTILTFGGYCNRVVPARSAPVYVHQLQAIPNILGSKSINYFLSLKKTIYLYYTPFKNVHMRGAQGLRSEAYILIRRNDESLKRNKADGRFSTA
jgi:hypothetical protein